MAEKNMKARIIHKHDTSENWAKATSFIPKQGEIIVYDIDSDYNYERFKIGDGVTLVNDLPFANDTLRAELLEQINAVDDKVDAVSALVGDTSVSEQINTAAINNQSDWSVNDETSPAYVKNRPFYTTDIMEIELCNGTYTFTSDEANDGTVYYGASDDFIVDTEKFYEGQNIKVVYDGVEYNLVCKYDTKYRISLYAGNGAFINSSFGETCAEVMDVPFCFIAGGSQFFTTDTDAEHTIAVYMYDTQDITIPSKYIDLSVRNGDGEESTTIGDIYNQALGKYSVAEGMRTRAVGNYSHAEGDDTVANGQSSHAEGSSSVASGFTAHAEGYLSQALGDHSHAEGYLTQASSRAQHVQGEWNEIDVDGDESTRGKYAHIVGNGTSKDTRSNAHTLDWSGNAWFAGAVKIGGTGQDDTAAKTLATTEYVDTAIAAIPTPDVSGQIATHNTSENAHSDIRTAISDVSALVGDTAVSEQINTAVAAIQPKCTSVILPAANWTGDANPWSQVVTVNGVTANSKVDLQPTAVQIVEMQDNDIAIMAENDDGVITVYAIGSKPTVDYTIQVLITEVAVG